VCMVLALFFSSEIDSHFFGAYIGWPSLFGACRALLVKTY